MRIYWHSTAPFGPSSYSVLTKRVVPDLVRQGHDLIVGTWYGLQGEPQPWPIRNYGSKNGVHCGTALVLPSLDYNSYGCDVFLPNYQYHKADVAISNMDVWVLPPTLTSQVRFAPWVPIDHDPVPAPVMNSLKPSVYTMCYSQWGTDLLKASGVDAHYVPCSADVNIYRPKPMDEARKDLGLPAGVEFLVSMVAANKDPGDRKGFGEAVQGFAKRFRGVPGAYLLIHTTIGAAVNIPHLVERMGVAAQTIFPDQYQYLMGQFPDEYMRSLYSASDVLLNPAKSEGFGLPVLEAQMCGCPVAVTNFSSMPELMAAGWLIEGQRHWSIGADSWRVLADIGSVADALDAAYQARGDVALREKARLGTLHYDCAKVAETHWRPALRDIGEIVAGNAGELKMVTF